jgi:3-deoxy-manno-octulosonate cytidylyltransferase (CMP-KDO synthetase)
VHPVGFRDPFDSTLPPPSVIAVIPARHDATRLPGKPLIQIAGRPMIEHVYRRAAAAPGVEAVVVATDDPRIADAILAFGGIVRMTDPSHRTGTDRIAEVARGVACDIVVNVQGDEPLIDPSTIGGVVAALTRDPSLQMASSCVALTDRGDHTNPNVVKVVRNLSGDALYFSRAPIPHLRGSGSGRAPVFKHLGLYAYRRAFLLAFGAIPQTPLEISESLEQLRALEHGHRIHLVETPFDSIGVDTPDDLERVRQHIAATARA